MNRVSRLAGITAGHFRAAIESMPPEEYLAAGYYERWMYGLQRRLEAAGTLTPDEVQAAMERVRGEPRLERSDPEFRRALPGRAAQRRPDGGRRRGALPAGSSACGCAGCGPRVTRAVPATCAAPWA